LNEASVAYWLFLHLLIQATYLNGVKLEFADSTSDEIEASSVTGKYVFDNQHENPLHPTKFVAVTIEEGTEAFTTEYNHFTTSCLEDGGEDDQEFEINQETHTTSAPCKCYS
jgi:hypothetical protein